MKATTDMTTETRAKRQAAKIKARSSRKATPRKTSAKRSAAPATGYGDTAAKFIARGKTAFGDAYTWAEEAGSALPRRVRGMSLPNPNAMQHFIVDRPLVLGAVGLGIGVALGWMLPSTIGGRPEANNDIRRPANTRKAGRK